MFLFNQIYVKIALSSYMNDSFVIIYESLFNSLSGIKAFYLLTLADTSYSVLKNAFFNTLMVSCMLGYPFWAVAAFTMILKKKWRSIVNFQLGPIWDDILSTSIRLRANRRERFLYYLV